MRGLLLCAAVFVLAGCGVKQVVVEDSFPAPITQQHAKHIGLYVDDAFRNYVYTEKLPNGGRWSVDIGAANLALFEQILAGMFTRVSSVSSPQATAGVDGVVRPEIQDYQFSTPDLNQTEFFEAWIKYQVRLYDNQGKQLASWPVKAYGRSEAKFLNKEESLLEATKVAMRDAAAAMVLEFDSNPAVRAFLYGQSDEQDAAPAVVRQESDNDAS